MSGFQVGDQVLVSKADSSHNGDVGTVARLHAGLSTVKVQLDGCVHTYYADELRAVPEQDAVPAPVDL